MCLCLIKMSQLNSRGTQPAGPLLFWELTLSINKGQIRCCCYVFKSPRSTTDANDLGSINKEMIIGI